MSTNHVVYSKENLGNTVNTVELYEHSNKFDLDIEVYETLLSLPDLSLEEVKAMVAKMAEVISYYDPDYKGVSV